MTLLTPGQAAARDRENQDACWTALTAGLGDPGAVIAVHDVTGKRCYWHLDAAQPMSSLPVASRGSGGVHWRITWLNGRPAVETNNLRNGAEIPERFPGQFPVNATVAHLGIWGRP